MTWTLITMPASEELATGYVPSGGASTHEAKPERTSEARSMRRHLVTLFAAFGLIAGLQNAFAGDPAHGPMDGQRRLAEINFTERKAECRDCAATLALGDPASGAL